MVLTTGETRRKVRQRARMVGSQGTSYRPRARARRAGDKFGCPQCKLEHKTADGKVSCDGHRRKLRPYQPCRAHPIEGGHVCPLHGGKIPAVQASAIKRLAYAEGEGEVAKMLRQLDMPDQHPIEGLLEVVRHSGGMFRLIGQLCAKLKLEPEDIGIAINEKTGEVTKWTKDTALYGYDHTGDQAPHVLLLLYKHWAEVYARACKLALDANIDERLVRNAEHTSQAMFTAVQRAISDTDMDASVAVAFTKNLARNLRALMDPFSTLEGDDGQGEEGQRQACNEAAGQRHRSPQARASIGASQGSSPKRRKRKVRNAD